MKRIGYINCHGTLDDQCKAGECETKPLGKRVTGRRALGSVEQESTEEEPLKAWRDKDLTLVFCSRRDANRGDAKTECKKNFRSRIYHLARSPSGHVRPSHSSASVVGVCQRWFCARRCRTKQHAQLTNYWNEDSSASMRLDACCFLTFDTKVCCGPVQEIPMAAPIGGVTFELPHTK